MRRLLAVVFASTLAALAVSAGGCGGGSTSNQPETLAELPPADPAAVREFLAGNRFMGRPGRGNQRRARRRFQKAIQIDPNLWEAHYNLGVLQRRAGDLEAAAGSFDAALQIQPRAPEPLLAAAEVDYARGEQGAAAERLETLLEGDPENLDARVALAVMLREDERYDAALEQAREVLVRDPQNIRALLEIGRAYRAREQYEVARLVLDKAVQLAPEDAPGLMAEVRNEQGLLELDRGDTQAAFQAFEQAIALDAAYEPARMNMGSVLLHAGDFAGAVAQYEAVLEQHPDDLAARVAYGAALRGQGEHRQARRQYERVLEADPENADALFNLAVLQAEFVDERTESRATFQRYLDAAPRRHPKREQAEEYLQLIPDPNAPPPPRQGGPP